MIEAVGKLVRYIVIIIFLAALLEMILPQGVFRRYLRMFVGILLIFTLLTPLQNIMRIAPQWEMPVVKERENSAELAHILQRGEEINRENIKGALGDYRYRIFQLLEKELAREFSQKLVRLDLAMEENPQSSEFGALQSINAAIRKLDAENSGQGKGEIEEIRISVEVTEKNEDLTLVIPDRPAEGNSTAARDSAEEIARYIAVYFQLPLEKVCINILP